MLIDFYKLIYLITNLFTIAIHLNFMHSIFERRKSNVLTCGFCYFLHFIVTSAIYVFFDVPILNLIVNLGMLFVITCNYKSTFANRIFVSIYILFFMAITEIILAACTGYFHFSFLTEGNYHDSIGLIIARILAFIFSLLFKNFRSLKQARPVSILKWGASIFIPTTTMLLEVMIIQSEDTTQTRVIISTILVLVLNVVAFYLYDSLTNSYAEIAKISVLEKENELYCRQCEIMQNATEELQSFRHDMSNQFSVITELLQKKKYDLAAQHVSSLSKKTTCNVIYSTTGNIIIDGLINYKLQCALEENITVHSEIAVPSDLEMDTSDIVVIIGNLLDNAISAILELQNDQRYLTIKIVYSMNRLIIHMLNPYKREVQYQNGEIVTSKVDSSNHGFGLKNIERIVEKYSGYMQINPDNNKFKVDILLYMN